MSERAITSFRDLFGRDPDVSASAPGRVNLIGEHTDYNDGCVKALRDLGPVDLDRMARVLLDPLFRRARRVVTENARVLEAVRALRASDVARLGALFDASHASMRDDYEVSVPPVDLLVNLARAEPEIAGARLTGGGFGGAVVILAKRGSGGAVAERVARAYDARSGFTPRVLIPTA